MNSDPQNAREYVQRLIAAISKCACIDTNDRSVPTRSDEGHTEYFIVRGFDVPGKMFANDLSAGSPFTLVRGGKLKFRAHIREIHNRAATEVQVVVQGYSFQVDGLDTDGNPNRVGCFRYDRPAGQPRGDGWENDLGDNPRHPHAHLHINYLTLGANDLRMPTGFVPPLLLFKAFDHWYYNMYKP
jgi:hypothetical protein